MTARRPLVIDCHADRLKNFLELYHNQLIEKGL
jgi:hypothetical protein